MNPKRPSGATIKDVARLAEVSIGTVSRVVNGRENVGADYRERVQRAVAELGYRPNVSARQLVTASSKIISFVLSNRSFVSPVHPRILQGASDYCEENGYFVLFSRIHYAAADPPDKLRLPAVLASHGAADCIILAGFNFPNLLASLEANHTPYVVFQNSFPPEVSPREFDAVGIDDYVGAIQTVEHLISLGHRRILYVGDTRLPWFATRYQGYLHALQQAGLEPCADTAPASSDLYGHGQQSVTRALASGCGFTAVLGGLDAVAYGAITALRAHGLRVPDDVSVAGFGDQYRGSREPALTTVHMDAQEVGRQLARMAIQKTAAPKKPIPSVQVSCRFIPRDSCSPRKSSF